MIACDGLHCYSAHTYKCASVNCSRAVVAQPCCFSSSSSGTNNALDVLEMFMSKDYFQHNWGAAKAWHTNRLCCAALPPICVHVSASQWNRWEPRNARRAGHVIQVGTWCLKVFNFFPSNLLERAHNRCTQNLFKFHREASQFKAILIFCCCCCCWRWKTFKYARRVVRPSPVY